MIQIWIHYTFKHKIKEQNCLGYYNLSITFLQSFLRSLKKKSVQLNLKILFQTFKMSPFIWMWLYHTWPHWPGHHQDTLTLVWPISLKIYKSDHKNSSNHADRGSGNIGHILGALIYCTSQKRVKLFVIVGKQIWQFCYDSGIGMGNFSGCPPAPQQWVPPQCVMLPHLPQLVAERRGVLQSL